MVDDVSSDLIAPPETGVRWMDLTGLHDLNALKAVGDGFGLHPLVVEDVADTGQRPKVEDYGNYLYIVFDLLG